VHDAAVQLDSERSAALDRELASRRPALAAELVEEYRDSLYA